MSQIPPYPPTDGSSQDYQSLQDSGGDGNAVASLTLGIVSMFAWFCPMIGLPVSILGIVFGSISRKKRPGAMALAGIILSIIGLMLSLVNAIWGAYLQATGQHPLVNAINGS